MLAALLYGQEDLRLEHINDPIPNTGEVVIKVHAATTCGTDLKVWRRGGHAKMLKPPTLFGHEAAGEIVAVGAGVTKWKIGDAVVANNSAPCGNCFFCKKQEFSLCPNLTWNNGTFAQYLKIPAQIVEQNLLLLPDVPYQLAAMTEPLACVLHGVARSNIKPGDRVVLLGDGAIGLMFVAKLVLDYYASVLVFGGNDQRLEIAKKFGAAETFNYHGVPDIAERVKELTDGYGADIVIEATGDKTVWETAIACARPGATVNLFGGCPKNTNISVSTEVLHYSELTIKGVFHNTPYFVREALSLIASRRIPFELLISEQRPLKDLEQVFVDMRERKVIKVAIGSE
ncbi:dehydrogenase [Dulcicalothrix desertica PCC 7102]|uniref:Dehydrogenase n=1 Tax=Dulcicalothrix desertica PCC 7102 TaxID=232991 RepID=A0A3S1CA94_9CYAN|nr:alcohol dehydrogenase catalytic domain-containing protein [Dulcicalothrix desertica]RUT03228.1 dehydrogenase [Dulcicalothrix desertica PCC 7102]TWH53598.1 L-iditol 2-dehydrogenase [Dulcicalothrix desertica PCC 7102]